MAAAVLGIAAGDHREMIPTTSDPDKPLAGLRIGVLGGWFQVGEPEVRRCTDEATSVLESLGAELVPLELSIIDRINPDAVKRVIVVAESAALHDSSTPGYGEVFSEILARGAEVRAMDYIHALRLASLLSESATGLFENVDALVSATCPIVAPPEESDTVKVNGRDYALADIVARNTSLFNISGHPAVTVPSGLTRDTFMPVGLQVVAPHWQDELCLRIAGAFEMRMMVPALPRAHAGELKHGVTSPRSLG